MTIESKLDEQTEVLKGIHTALQSFLAAFAAQGTPAAAPSADAPVESAAPKGRGRPKKDATATDTSAADKNPMGLVDGDPEGTRYWVSDTQVYAQTPGNPDPEDQSFKISGAAEYLTKKEALAAKKPDPAPAATAQTSASSGPSATPAQATASDVKWDTVLQAIVTLNKLPAEQGGGREAVLAVLKEFGCEGKLVRELEALGRHAEILKFVNDQIAGGAASDDLGI
ncbi:hypothetical protein Acf1_00027 [Acidovorax phage ACF1]|nr:hypothetical protein Acf1_00027 [Acidovorax phage ACF1]